MNVLQRSEKKLQKQQRRRLSLEALFPSIHKFGSAHGPALSSGVSPTAQIESGAIALPHAIVNTNCVVKSGCIVNCGAIVDHGCVLEEGVHICLGAVVKAENRIPRCMKIEAGEVVQNRAYPL